MINAQIAAQTAVNYKKKVTQNFIALAPEQMAGRLAGQTFWVSRKYDGLLTLLFWDGKTVSAFNSSGAAIENLPCFDEAAALLGAAKLKEAVIAAELCADESAGRSRVFDAVKALADTDGKQRLFLAVFDIVSLDGADYKSASWEETYRKITALFGKGAAVKPVLAEKAKGVQGVQALFETWVAQGGAEGIVARSELPLVFKIKSRYSIDAVVAGFSVGTPPDLSGRKGGAGVDEVRTLLLALVTEDGGYQIIGRCGNGIKPEERRPLCEKLMHMRVPSNYIETDSNHAAFYMVQPELVVEIACNDVLFENSSGPVMNQVLGYGGTGYARTGAVPGCSLINAAIERWRDDKKADKKDARLSQISGFLYNPWGGEKPADQALPRSKLLKREVYQKVSGSKLMVLKFLLWKTNKEKSGWPAFVCVCVNYSSDRAEPLKQDMRISGSQKQIEELYAAFVADNVKKGWEKV